MKIDHLREYVYSAVSAAALKQHDNVEIHFGVSIYHCHAQQGTLHYTIIHPETTNYCALPSYKRDYISPAIPRGCK